MWTIPRVWAKMAEHDPAAFRAKPPFVRLHGVVYTGYNCVHICSHVCVWCVVCVWTVSRATELAVPFFFFSFFEKPQQLQCGMVSVCVCVSMMEEKGVTQT